MEAGKTKSPQKQWSDANETFNGHFDRIPPIMIQLYLSVLVFVFAIQLQVTACECGNRIGPSASACIRASLCYIATAASAGATIIRTSLLQQNDHNF